MLLIALLCCIANVSFGQLLLQGMVVDEKRAPIAGANVWLEYTNIGTATDENGVFTLQKVPEGEYTIRATAMNYDGKKIKVTRSKSDILFVLDKSPLKLNEVVVTGTGTHNRLKNSPIAISVTTAKEIKNAGGFSSFENSMIALNPSFTFSPNAMGSHIQLNGLSNRYILVLVDGKKIGGDISGNVDLARINMNNVKRIEVLKGGASSLYGSEAIAGVVNIITDKHKENIYASSDTRYSKYGQFTQALNLSLNAGNFSSETSYQRNQSDGWQLNPQTLNGDVLVDTEAQASPRFYSDVVNQRFTYAPSKELTTYVEGSLYDKKIKRAISVNTYDLLYKDYTIGMGGKYLLKNNGSISLDMNTDNFESWQTFNADDTRLKALAGDEQMKRRQKYYYANLKGIVNAGTWNRISVGTDYRLDYLKSDTDVKDGRKEVNTYAFYAQDEMKFLDNKLQLVPGFRYVYHETFKNRITPKMAAMYSLPHFNFRASYSSGFRSPDLKQLYYEIESKGTLTVGNTELKPESSNYYSIGTEYVSNNLSISINGYINRLKNMIDKTQVEILPTDPTSVKKKEQYINIGRADIKGVDISFDYYVGSGLSFGGGYAYVRAVNVETRETLDRISRHIGNVNANWFKDWGVFSSNFNINGRLQSKRYFLGEWARTYQLWNIATNHKLKEMGGVIFEPGFGIENIFNFVDNRPYGSSYATLSPGRTFYVSLSIKFSN